MKKLLLTATVLAVCSINGLASVYIKYYNKDSKKYTFVVKMDGQTKSVEFNASTSGAATIQGSGRKAVVETACGNVEIDDNSKIEIKDGCIKIVN